MKKNGTGTDNADKKPRIGVMVGNYHTDLPTRVVALLWARMKEEGLAGQFYIGTESSSFMTEFEMEENRFDYLYSSLYGLCRFDALDALIVSLGTMTLYQATTSEESFLALLPDLPVILIGNDYKIQNGASLISDNYHGIYRCVEHLVKVHHCKKIGYVSGKDRIREAFIRREAVRDALLACGQDLPEDRIAKGDFSEHVDAEVQALLDRHPDLDALVCANDEMGIAVYRVLRERGICPGKDIAVTGFDDMVLARYMDPPLTTARQEFETICRLAFDKTLKILKGEKPESEIVPVPFIRRCSCGCSEYDLRTEEREEQSKDRLVHDVLIRRQNQRHTWISALLARELLLETPNIREFFDKIGNSFVKLKTKNSYICLLEDPAVLKEGEVLGDVDHLIIMMHQNGDRYTVYDLAGAPRLTEDASGLLQEMGLSEGIYMTFLLFYEENLFGTMSVEAEPSEIDFYYSLSLEIGSSIRNLFVSLDEQRHRAELQAIARHDDLTGIFNRSGFESAAAGFVSLHEKEKMALLIGDLDHLKEINDHFGHLEGDNAIIETSRILREVLGKHNILGRMGGDEFIGLMTIRSKEDIHMVVELIRRKCSEYNRHSDKPYLVEISVGCIPFESADFAQFDMLQRKADLQMYAAKELRRPTAIR